MGDGSGYAEGRRSATRIQEFNNQETVGVRMGITASGAEPMRRKLAVYNVPPLPAGG